MIYCFSKIYYQTRRFISKIRNHIYIEEVPTKEGKNVDNEHSSICTFEMTRFKSSHEKITIKL